MATSNSAESSAVQSLIASKQQDALQTLMLLRAAVGVFYIFLAIFVAESEREAVWLIMGCYIGAALAGYALVRRGMFIDILGRIGALSDVLLIWSIPIVMSLSINEKIQQSGVDWTYVVRHIFILPGFFVFILMNGFSRRMSDVVLVTAAFLSSLIFALFYIDGTVQDAWLDSDIVPLERLRQVVMEDALSGGTVFLWLATIVGFGLLVVLLTRNYHNTVKESASLERANATLGRSFPPNLVAKIQESPEILERTISREISFIMTDLENFTPLIEKTPSDVAIPLLNEYFDGMIEIIFRYDGTVEKIVGDAIAVMFSAPVEQPDHRERSLKCAMEMDGFAKAFREKHIKRVKRLGRTRIGVHSGMATVGNFGGDKILNFTARGEAINLTARLESANKVFGTSICVGYEFEGLVDGFYGRPIVEARLKGSTRTLDIFEPVSEEYRSSDQCARYLKAYALLNTDSDAAQAAFQELRAEAPDDPVVTFHCERLASGATSNFMDMRTK